MYLTNCTPIILLYDFIISCKNHQSTCIKNLFWSVLAKVNDIVLLFCLRVMEKELNNPGRGFNIVVLDKDSKKPKFVSRFDTYEGGKEKVLIRVFRGF